MHNIHLHKQMKLKIINKYLPIKAKKMKNLCSILKLVTNIQEKRFNLKKQLLKAIKNIKQTNLNQNKINKIKRNIIQMRISFGNIFMILLINQSTIKICQKISTFTIKVTVNLRTNTFQNNIKKSQVGIKKITVNKVMNEIFYLGNALP